MNRVTNIISRTASVARIGGFACRYDSLGDRVTTVSDRNFNGVADLAGPDLVSSNETRYVGSREGLTPVNMSQ